MCLSRCSSLVNDWPQYVQNTILAPGEWVVEGLGPCEEVGGRVSVADWARVYGRIRKSIWNEGKGIISCKVYQCHGGGARWSKGRGMV